VKFYSNYGDVADEIRISEPTKVGESITVTLPPFDEFDMHNGKYIGSWNTNRVGTGTSYATGQEVTFTEAEILFAKWVPAYLLTVTADPAAGGTATKVPASRDNFMAGETIELHAEPEPGYYLVNWTDGTSVLGSALDWDHTMPASNYEVTANFEKIPYGVTIVRSAGGKISIDPKKDAYYYGDEITLTAKPNDGYRFVRWIITGESGGKELTALAAADPLTNPVYSCTVFEDMVIDAEYKWVGLITEQPHTVSYHLNGGTGTVPVDMHRYYKGDKVTLASGTGLYRPGAFFMGWATADGTLVKSPYTMGTKDVTFFAVWSAVDYPEIPKTGDEASFLGFAMIALALAAMGYVILRKVHA
jgi:LPXTG-motif cell wall-anchored protein